jgi:hypothetical protein
MCSSPVGSKINPEPDAQHGLVRTAAERHSEVVAKECPFGHVGFEAGRNEGSDRYRCARVFVLLQRHDSARAREVVVQVNRQDAIGASFPGEVYAGGKMWMKPGVVEELILLADA